MYSVLLSILLLAPAGDTSAESDRLARGASLGWAALVCSGYSEMAKLPEEEGGRLQTLGLEKLRAYLAGLRDGRVLQADIQAKVPWIVAASGRGPNVEFALGRVFEMAMRDAVEKVRQPIGGEYVFDDELAKVRAQGFYDEQNCRHLGA